MADTLYFQWQNDALAKTIYPLREMKLRDFLIAFQEIDTWAEYKGKNVAGLSAEIQAYHADQARAVKEAYQAYARLRAYFLKPDVRADYARFSPIDEAELLEINNLHGTFVTYLNRPNMADVRREKNFVSERVYDWETHRKDIQTRVAAKQRRINAIRDNNPNHPSLPKETQELARLQNVTLAMAEQELTNLYNFVSTYNKIEARKLELYKTKQSALNNRTQVATQLADAQSRLKVAESKQRSASEEVTRLKSPPSLAPLEKYFATPDVSAQLRVNFPAIDAVELATVNGIHKGLSDELVYSKTDAAILTAIHNRGYQLQQAQAAMQKEIVKHTADLGNMPADWKERPARQARLAYLQDTGTKVLAAELKQVNDYAAAFEVSRKPQAELAQTIQAKEKDLAAAQAAYNQVKAETTNLESQVKSIDSALSASEEQYLTDYKPAGNPSLQDLARAKVEQYKASLKDKTASQLLELIAQRFFQQPERYPLWLQYMVVHFSGMRYASAHGSWADPKDLLVSLRTMNAAQDFKKMDDDAIQALCQQKILVYESPATATGKVPPLATAKDPAWRDKIALHLRQIKSIGPSYRRQGLLDLRLTEESYEVELMSAEQVKEAFEGVKDSLPEWMWKEIVKMTDLRVTQAHDPNWEKLTPEEQEQRYAPQYDQFRQIMDKWTSTYITGWREEHAKSNELIVTRAVCNEVAEHIQHLRGHAPDGGLTAKAPWYMKQEKEKKIPGTPAPYFKRPRTAQDYTPGASVLWLRFVNEEPNPWRIARPLTTLQGDGLIAKELIGVKSASGWTYATADSVTRSRIAVNDRNAKVKEVQWLRWIHEATVVQVAETADGPIVFTFETALPYEDRRLSTIGLFRHDLDWMLSIGSEDTYNASFVGYVPEFQPPLDDLSRMLDWSKILLRPIQPAETAAYKKKYPF